MDAPGFVGFDREIVDEDVEAVFEDETARDVVVDVGGDGVAPLPVVGEDAFGEFEWLPDAHATVTEGADGVAEEAFFWAVVHERGVCVGEDELDAPESVGFRGELAQYRVALFGVVLEAVVLEPVGVGVDFFDVIFLFDAAWDVPVWVVFDVEHSRVHQRRGVDVGPRFCFGIARFSGVSDDDWESIDAIAVAPNFAIELGHVDEDVVGRFDDV